jgi:2-polyprenyl-6-methoxyphenol hydroxylase-like FAD-dependent oxidoreductase
MSGHYIHPAGGARLARWGLLDRLLKTNCPAIQTTTMDLGEFRLTGTHLPVDGIIAGVCPRRRVVDALLVEAAVEAGVEFREGFTVLELVSDRGKVIGIRGRSRHGALVTEHARITIGADGMYSMVAGSLKAKEYKAMEPLTCSYYSYWSGVPLDGLELYPRSGRFVFAAPTHDGLTMINVVAPRAEFRAFRSDTESHFASALERAPEFASRVRAGQQVERFIGTADTTNFFRVPYGPGWALAGDAGYHKDPISAQGMTDAFRDAEKLAEAVDAGFSGRLPLEEVLASYHAERDAAVLPLFELTCDMARLTPPSPQMQALLDVLRHNQADTDRYFGVLAGTVGVSEFFAQENQQRILAAAPTLGSSVLPPKPYRAKITCA